MKRSLAFAKNVWVVVMGVLSVWGVCVARADDAKVQFIEAVGQDIEALKKDYPQLEDFEAGEHASADDLKVTYGFHTHQSTHRGGWVAGVPNPDADGIWFYIDVHPKDSMAQIHTQPANPQRCLGKDRVSFLILEGEDTKAVGGEIWKILERHGATMCGVKPETEQ